MTFAGLLQSGMIQETADAAALRYDLNERLTVFRSGCSWINEQGADRLLSVVCQRSTGRERLVFDLSDCEALPLWMQNQSDRSIQSMLTAVADSLNELIAAAYLNAALTALDFQHIYVSERDGGPRLLCLPLCLAPPDRDPAMPLAFFEAAVSEQGLRAISQMGGERRLRTLYKTGGERNIRSAGQTGTEGERRPLCPAGDGARSPVRASDWHLEVTAASPPGCGTPAESPDLMRSPDPTRATARTEPTGPAELPATGGAETVAWTQRLPHLAADVGQSSLILEAQDGGSPLIPDGFPYRIGQAPACEGRLAGCPAVSRQHCTLLSADGRVMIRDDHSLNGTFVNGIRLRPGCPEPLSPGDRVQLADIVYRVRPFEDWIGGCLPPC